MTDDDDRPTMLVPRPRPRRFRRPTGTEIVRWLSERYGALPAWLLLVQVFLAAGWLRAASAHGLSTGWWTGQEITDFALEHQTVAVEWYRAVMLDGPVRWVPIAIGAIVLLGQLTVAVLLALNLRPLVGLGLGAFLNVNFVLAGAVEPSAFYLVLGAALGLWHVEATMTTARCWWLTVFSTVVGFTLIGSLMPQITTMDPANVIDDPAMVLTFIALLWVAALWVTFARRTIIHRPQPDDGPGWTSRPMPTDKRPALSTVGGERELTDTIRLVIGSGQADAATSGDEQWSPEDRPAS